MEREEVRRGRKSPDIDGWRARWHTGGDGDRRGIGARRLWRFVVDIDGHHGHDGYAGQYGLHRVGLGFELG